MNPKYPSNNLVSFSEKQGSFRYQAN